MNIKDKEFKGVYSFVWPRIGIRGGMWKAQYENFKFRDFAVTGKAVIEINALHSFGMLRNVGNRLISDAVSCL
jgi:hypothetical protein